MTQVAGLTIFRLTGFKYAARSLQGPDGTVSASEATHLRRVALALGVSGVAFFSLAGLSRYLALGPQSEGLVLLVSGMSGVLLIALSVAMLISFKEAPWSKG